MNDTTRQSKLNLPQRMGGLIHGAVTTVALYAGKMIKESACGLWSLIGSDQLRNAIMFVGLISVLFVTSRFLLWEKELRAVSDNVKFIADSQRIQGFAYMHQLQSSGVLPPDAPASGTAVPSADPQAISPEALNPPKAPAQPRTKAP